MSCERTTGLMTVLVETSVNRCRVLRTAFQSSGVRHGHGSSAYAPHTGRPMSALRSGVPGRGCSGCTALGDEGGDPSSGQTERMLSIRHWLR